VLILLFFLPFSLVLQLAYPQPYRFFDDTAIVFLAPFALAIVLGIGSLFPRLFLLPKVVDNVVSILLAVLFQLCACLFVYWLSGYISRSMPIVITIHLAVVYASLLLCACIDMWNPLHFIPHLIFWAFEIVAIVATVLIDWKRWYVVLILVIWLFATYWFLFFDGLGFHNKLYPAHNKQWGVGVMTLSQVASPLILPIAAVLLLVLYLKRRPKILPR
jgi:hypothetical protein